MRRVAGKPVIGHLGIGRVASFMTLLPTKANLSGKFTTTRGFQHPESNSHSSTRRPSVATLRSCAVSRHDCLYADLPPKSQLLYWLSLRTADYPQVLGEAGLVVGRIQVPNFPRQPRWCTHALARSR